MTAKMTFNDLFIPEPNSGCWLWLGRLNQDGYGMFNPGRRTHGTERAHRVAFMLYRGPIPEGLMLDHLCHVRCCINPDHLDPCTNQENIRRGRNNNAWKTHCPKGHEYTPSNTLSYKNERRCRQCARLRESAYQKHKRLEGFTKNRGKWKSAVAGPHSQ